MSSRTIVMVYDQEDSKHGEISIMESAQKAARLVETLLEAGFDQERIRVFTGEEMGMQVTHRPVVALVNGGTPAEQPPAPIEEPLPEAGPEKELAEAIPHGSRGELQEVALAAPFTKDGVRFSSLFRPA